MRGGSHRVSSARSTSSGLPAPLRERGIRNWYGHRGLARPIRDRDTRASAYRRHSPRSTVWAAYPACCHDTVTSLRPRIGVRQQDARDDVRIECVDAVAERAEDVLKGRAVDDQLERSLMNRGQRIANAWRREG